MLRSDPDGDISASSLARCDEADRLWPRPDRRRPIGASTDGGHRAGCPDMPQGDTPDPADGNTSRRSTARSVVLSTWEFPSGLSKLPGGVLGMLDRAVHASLS